MESRRGSSSRTDRSIVERNRRNQMRILYYQLNSLIPNQSEVTSLPDQLGEAISYIKKLQKKIEKLKEKKDHLMGVENISKGMSSGMMVGSKPPQIEIHNMGSALNVVLISGIDNQSLFYAIIRVLHEEGAEIVTASFSVHGDTVFHSIHSEVGESALGYGVARISRRLQKLVHDFVYAL